MVYCLDPDATVTRDAVIATEMALGMPQIKAVQALSELLADGELVQTMSLLDGIIRIRIPKKEASE